MKEYEVAEFLAQNFKQNQIEIALEILKKQKLKEKRKAVTCQNYI